MAICWRHVASPSASRSLNLLANLKGSYLLHGTAIQVVRTVSTTQPCLKRTPHTVGVPAWAKATQRRRRSLARLGRPKSIENIKAEYRLANDPTELNLYTTTRRGPMAKDMDSQLDSLDIVLTADKSMYVCYHPEKPYPLQRSKEADVTPWWHLNPREVQRYRDSLTPEETAEVKRLRKRDPKLWSVNSLSHLLHVKPLAVMLAAPLTEEQKYEVNVERQVLKQWSEYKRREYRANQELERQRYVEETRGKTMKQDLGLQKEKNHTNKLSQPVLNKMYQ